MKKIFITAIVTGVTLFSQVHAHDFITQVNGQTLYLSITDTARRTAIVTYEGKASSASEPKAYRGIVTIPVRVTVRGVTYRVTGIGPKAFSNSPSLTGIIIPGGVTEIGDFAFDGCSSLESIVFPGNEVSIGEGAFYRCPSVSRVTLGSDWTSVNLNIFRWSRNLEEISIPAKVRQIKNLKTLQALKRVSVDANNPYYKSHDGLLYSSDSRTLLAVPRGLDGTVTVRGGTEHILKGALSDCYSISGIELPATITDLSYREFSELTELRTIIMHSHQPIMTAVRDGQQIFALMVTPGVSLIVPKKARKAYMVAVSGTRGEYAELPTGTGTIPVLVHEEDLLQATSIIGDKKLK